MQAICLLWHEFGVPWAAATMQPPKPAAVDPVLMLQPAQVPISAVFSQSPGRGMPCFRSWVWSHLHSTGFSGTSKTEGICHDTVFSGSICFIVDTQHLKLIAISNKNIDRYGPKLVSKNDLSLKWNPSKIINVSWCVLLFLKPHPFIPPNLGKKSEVSMTCSQVKSLKVHLPFVFPPRPPCLVQSNRGWQLKGSGWRQGVVLRRCENTREHRFWVGRKLNSTWWVMVDVDDEIWWFSNLQISYENITSGHASKSKALHHRLSMDCHGLKFNDWCICNILQFWLVVSGF